MKNANRIHKLLFLLTLISSALGLCGTNLYRAALAQGGTWAAKASTPTSITGHAVGVAGGKLYSVGGSNGAPCCNIFPAPTFAYDPATNTWTTKTTMSLKRKNLAAGVAGGILYAVGGDNDLSYFATNEAYDPATDIWAVRASMPTPRSFPSAEAVNGILYVVGGENSTGVFTTVEAYNPATDTWTTKAPMLHPRTRGHAVTEVNGILYVIGGTDNFVELATVEAYDPTTNVWMNKAPMPTARHALAAAVVNGIIYAIGGFNNGFLSTVEAYDPATNTWATLPSMPTTRASLGAAEINGAIYAVGGGTPVAVDTVEAFTPTPPTCVTPPSGMVSWWPGDGNADDIKDSNNGILQGGATFGAGKVGQAFSFDGINGLVLVSSASNLDLEQAFTIDAWVNLADVDSAHCIVTKGLVDNHQYALLTGDLAAPDELELLVRRQASASDGLDRLITVNQAHLVPNRWYHVAATADGTNKSIYLDGQLLATNSAVGPYTTFSPAVEIGSGNGGTVAFAHGLIDEVEIYDRALTQAEIQAIYNAGSAGKCKPSANNAPVARCQNVTVSAGPGCSANASIDNGSFDPDGDPITITQSPTGPYSLGNTSVTLTVTDSHGASNSCTATVTVADDSTPEITSIPSDASYQCAASVPPGAPSQATATDNCGTPTITASDSSNGGAGSPASPLVITRTYTATDAAGNHVSLSQSITVIDNTPPMVSCPATPTTLSVGSNCQAAIPDVTGLVGASDNCTQSASLGKTQNPTAGTMRSIGMQTVTVTVTDAAGNSSQCAVTLNLVDDTPPSLNCSTNIVVDHSNVPGQCSSAVNYNVTATDNCAGAVVSCSPPSGSVFPKGSTSVNCIATDSSNNSTGCSFTVCVIPPQLTALGPAMIWLGLKNSDDVGIKFDLFAEVFKNGSPVGSGELDGVPGGSSGFNNAVLRTINPILSAPADVCTGDTMSLRLSVRVAATSGHRAGTARLWFNDAAANSRFDATVGGATQSYYLDSGSALRLTVGPGPKDTIDVFVDRAVGGNPFKPFGTWVLTF
jgi:N-acetylneuraminic acid mutarotase